MWDPRCAASWPISTCSQGMRAASETRSRIRSPCRPQLPCRTPRGDARSISPNARPATAPTARACASAGRETRSAICIRRSGAGQLQRRGGPSSPGDGGGVHPWQHAARSHIAGADPVARRRLGHRRLHRGPAPARRAQRVSRRAPPTGRRSKPVSAGRGHHEHAPRPRS